MIKNSLVERKSQCVSISNFSPASSLGEGLKRFTNSGQSGRPSSNPTGGRRREREKSRTPLPIDPSGSGSPQSSAHGVERQRSASLTEVEDSWLDVPSARMVSGARSHDTHSSREEMLDPEGASSEGTVTRERSQVTIESQMSAHLHLIRGCGGRP